jgi:hypothetical protein
MRYARRRARALPASIGAALVLGGLLAPGLAFPVRSAERSDVEVVATGIVRPIQVALTASGRLVVLALGQGDAAGEIVEVDPGQPLPFDASRLPRIVVPFAEESRKTTLGSLAVDPRSGDIFLGEENGNRVYRLTEGRQLTPIATGLNHLVGGGGIALDPQGRLVILDYMSPETQLRSESPPPPALAPEIAGSYHGPLVFRVDVQEPRPLPRRLDLFPPLFPRGATSRPHAEPLWRFMSVAPLPGGDLIVLDSLGGVSRLTAQGDVTRVARLPPGHYHRTNMALAPDGSVVISSGFQVRDIFRVSPAGTVTRIARELADPQGIVVDSAGTVYVAETAFGRIIRLRPAP